MIQKLTTMEPARKLLDEISGDPELSVRMRITPQTSASLQEALSRPDRLVLGVFGDNGLTGLFDFLVIEAEQYMEMLAAITRSETAYAELAQYLQDSYAGFQADFVFHPDNSPLLSVLTRRGAVIYPPQQRMILKDDGRMTDTHGIEPFSERYRQQYLEMHARNCYWTGEKILAAHDEFQVFLAVEDGKVIGYIDMTCGYDENEPLDIWVRPEHRGKGWGKRLMAKAIQANRPNGMALLVDVDNVPAISLYTSAGFEKDVGQENQTATWEIAG